MKRLLIRLVNQHPKFRSWVNVTLREFLLGVLTNKRQSFEPFKWLLLVAVVDLLIGVWFGYLIWG
jgi:hypothetical protein